MYITMNRITVRPEFIVACKIRVHSNSDSTNGFLEKMSFSTIFGKSVVGFYKLQKNFTGKNSINLQMSESNTY